MGSLKFKWQQVSSALLESTQYLSQSQQCCGLISFLPKISSSSILFPRFIRCAPTMIGVMVTFMFKNFFCSHARSRYLSNFLFSFAFTPWSARIIIIIIITFLLWEFFHTSISKWFPRVWVTASLLKSPELYSVFWLYYGWTPLVLLFPYPPVPVPILCDCTKPTNYNWYHHHFHVPHFFKFPSKVVVLTFIFVFFQFYSVVSWCSKVCISASFLFLLTIIRSGRLAKIKWSVCISKSWRNLCISFTRTDFGLCIYHLFEWSNFNFMHNSQWITLSTQSCLVLYSFCACLLHPLIMWLILSSIIIISIIIVVVVVVVVIVVVFIITSTIITL